MSTIRANDRMMGALAVRQLEGKRDALRARIEADPARPFQSKLTAAEQHLFHRRYDAAVEGLDEVRELLDARDAERVERAANAEHDRHLSEQGTDTRRETDKAITRDGWLWLLDKEAGGRFKKRWMTSERAMVGTAWRQLYLADQPISPLSSADMSAPSGGPGLTMEDIRRRAMSAKRYSDAKGRLTDAIGDTGLSDLLDAVCGMGRSCRELASNDDRRVIVVETQLQIALDMAGVALGMKR